MNQIQSSRPHLFLMLLFLVVPAAFLASSAMAQTTSVGTRKFDVVSIHPVPQNAPIVSRQRGWTPVQPGGYVNNRASLSTLITFAYNISDPERHLLGLPDWGNRGFDVAAKVLDNPADLSVEQNQEQVRTMVSQMLSDRFQLKVHEEVREEPIFRLTVAGRGPGLKEVPAPSGTETEGRIETGFSDAKILISAKRVRISSLARVLTLLFQRPVKDETGLEGYFDFDERWISPETSSPLSTNKLGENGTSLLITSLRERFGFRISGDRGTARFVIVDSVQRPSEN